MSDENQAPAPPEGPAPRADGTPVPHPAFEFLGPTVDTPEPFDALGPVAPPPLPRKVLHSALALALLGLAALLLGQVEASLLIAIAALYFVAQSADLHPAMGRVYALLAWVPPVLSAVLMAALAHLLLTNGALTPLRIGVAVASGVGALTSLAMLWPSGADRLVRLLFRSAGSSRTLRLTASLAFAILWVAFPAWLAFRDQLAGLLQDPGALVSASKLSGGLVGYVVLALASVGFMVRRDARGALDRLGLTGLRPADGLTVVAGIVALWLFNLGSEGLEQSVFPAMWASDQAFTAALAGVMGPGLMLLLSLSAGIGEEITLRGALQPKLGIALTSLLFAALHIQYSWYGMVSILVFGLILGLIRMRSSTTAAVLVHVLYDLLAVASAKP
jgi:membrane protease YdiL (CAAX protease family)